MSHWRSPRTPYTDQDRERVREIWSTLGPLAAAIAVLFVLFFDAYKATH